MKKSTRIIKSLFAVVLTLSVLFGNIGILAPKLTASAAANKYTVSVTIKVTDKADKQSQIQDSYFTVNYKTNNGTGSDGTYTYSLKTNNSLSTEKTLTISVDVDGFPSSVYFYHDAVWTELVHFNVTKITVSGPSGYSSTGWEGTEKFNGGGIGNNSIKKTINLNAAKPAVNSVSVSQQASVKIPTTGANTTHTYTATIKDQYGVDWYADPEWSENSSYASVAGSGKSGTVTFKNHTSDYTVTTTATCGGKSATAKTTVYVPHTVTIKPNGGTYNKTSSDTVLKKYTNDTLTISAPERTGYRFVSWTVSGGSYNTTTRVLTVNNSNATLTANWKANDYTLNFNANGGSCDTEKQPVTYDSPVGALPTATREGCDFRGWFTAADGGSEITASTVYKTAGDSTAYAHWSPNNSALAVDKTVIDFGLPVKIDVLANDEILKNCNFSGTVVGFGSTLPEASDTLASGFTKEYTVDGGKFTIADNQVVYTPNGFISDTSTVYVAVQSGTRYVYSKLTVSPATVIYYEDDFSSSAITYTDGVAKDGSTGKWMTVGTTNTSSAFQNLDDAVYGYDEIYADASNSTYSMGASHIVSVSPKNNPNEKFSGSKDNSWPCAQFVFAGTGFDVVSLISNTTGAVQVKVFSGTAADSANLVKSWLVDTYYTYTKDGSDWVVSDTPDTLYQIPVISYAELPYGTYTVQIIPMYSTVLDHSKTGRYDFYLDAIRIYDPTGVGTGNNDNPEIKDIYSSDKELVAYEANIRNLLISANDLGNENGVIFITSKHSEGTIEDYKKAGPNNEVYLAKGQSVAFNVTCDKIPDKILISAHAPAKTAASMRFGFGGSDSASVNIATAATLYYEIPFAQMFVSDGNGGYITKSPIVIANNGEGLLSLCNIKFTYSDETTAAAAVTMNTESAARAKTTAVRLAALSPEDGAQFAPEMLDADNTPEVVTAGKTAELTFTTTADTARLTVNGENAELVSEENGVKTWKFVFTAGKKSDTEEISLVAYDDNGTASEETTVEITVETAFRLFFDKLRKFIMMVVEKINAFLG